LSYWYQQRRQWTLLGDSYCLVDFNQPDYCTDKHAFMTKGDFKALAYVLALTAALLGVVFVIYVLLT
jgi:hypothetical protein